MKQSDLTTLYLGNSSSNFHFMSSYCQPHETLGFGENRQLSPNYKGRGNLLGYSNLKDRGSWHSGDWTHDSALSVCRSGPSNSINPVDDHFPSTPPIWSSSLCRDHLWCGYKRAYFKIQTENRAVKNVYTFWFHYLLCRKTRNYFMWN